MAAGIHDVLFRLIGDETDARQALEEVAAELEAFSAIHSEAEVDVTTGDVSERLDELRLKLERLDATNAEPRISADIAGVVAQIEVLQAELSRLDGEDVTIDVNMRKDLLTRMRSLTSQTGLLSRAVQKSSSESKGFAARILDSAVNMGPFTTQVRTAIPIVLGLASVIDALIAGAVALISSALEAAAGLGALATAFAGVLVPAVGLGIAAIQRYKAQSDVAGSAANALHKAIGALGQVWHTLLPAADPVLRAMAGGLQNVATLVKAARPAFMAFGQGAAQALRLVSRALATPEMRRGLIDLVRGAVRALVPMMRIGLAVARIFLAVANAAMPFLVDALSAVADWLTSIGNAAQHSTILGGIIGVLVGQLKVWVDLAGQLGRVFLGVIEAAAPAGQQLVQWLTEGARSLADWVSSAEGQDRIKQFMAEMIPIVEGIIQVIGQVIIAFLQLGEVMAPVIGPALQLVAALLHLLNVVLVIARPMISPFLLFGKIITLVAGLVNGLADLLMKLVGVEQFVGHAATGGFGGLVGAVKGAWHAIAGFVPQIAHTVAQGVSTAWRGMIDTARTVFHGILSVARAVFGGALRGVVAGGARTAVNGARAALNTLRNVASSAFHAVINVARSTFNALRGVVVGAARAAASGFRSAVNALKSAASSAFHAVVNAARSILSGLGDAVRSGMQAAVHAVQSAGQAIAQAAQSIWNRVKSILSAPISLHISVPNPGGILSKIPGLHAGTLDFAGGLAVVGEQGPEIVDLPRGARVHSNQESRQMVRNAPGQPGDEQGDVNFYITTPPGSDKLPDVRLMFAQLSLLYRQHGVRLPNV